MLMLLTPKQALFISHTWAWRAALALSGVQMGMHTSSMIPMS